MLPEGQQFFDEEIQKSFEKGIEKGRAASLAAAVIDVLEARGISLSSAQRERILACSDLGTLGRWVRAAATVATAEALLE